MVQRPHNVVEGGGGSGGLKLAQKLPATPSKRLCVKEKKVRPNIYGANVGGNVAKATDAVRDPCAVYSRSAV